MTEDKSPTLDAILRQRRRRTLLRSGAAGLLLAAIAGFFWLRCREAETPAAPPPAPPPPAVVEQPAAAPAPAPVPAAAPVPEDAAPEAEPLPALDASDDLVRRLAAALSSRPELIAWLASDELIRRFVAGVDAVAEGRSPGDQVPASLRPKEKFRTVTAGGAETASPSAFARYDTVTEVVSGLDSAGLVRAYRELEPLFDEAYRDLGYPERDFDAALRAAIFHLLRAPVVVGQPQLESHVLSYAYVDPALEDLSAAQKLLLRFGPSNAPRIQRKLREIALALDVPEAELPATPLYQAPAPE